MNDLRGHEGGSDISNQAKQGYQATPHQTLLDQLLDSRVAKTEREHAAAREIERLRAERDALCGALKQIITMAERGLGLDPSSMDNYFVWIQDKALAAIDAAMKLGG